ncbi:hypothetical protein CHISP_1396 [Chitinispirillum alkaliphilum]|nr:hypothetical protein CHISP_1396 [Chitinispirillum alkaliphilum]
MKPFLLLMISLLFTGCILDNQNELKIKNYAEANVIFIFRAKEHIVAPGRTITLSDVPNGSYPYSIIYELPSGATTASFSGDVTGTAAFSYSNTKCLIVYASNTENNIYNLSATKTTTHSTGNTSLISPR